MQRIIEELKKNYLIAFNGLVSLIEYCPEKLWTEKSGGYLFAQQILHAIACSIHYLHYEDETEELNEPIIARADELQPELKKTAKEVLNKKELQSLVEKFRHKINSYFKLLEDRIEERSISDNNQNNLGVVLMEIRHLSYHAGHLDCILREKGFKSPGWGYLS
jgi:DNA replicative helicase MCM subunit Mcm2 (Cdc46/Mcm family)